MKNKCVLHVLAIGSQKWYMQFSARYVSLTQTYKFEFISDVANANVRLDHNSYDVLVIEDAFIKDNSINLFKKAYAMSRPTIIICNSPFRYISYILWKKFDIWPNKFTLAKSMIFIRSKNDLTVLDNIQALQKCHDNLKAITDEISSVVF